MATDFPMFIAYGHQPYAMTELGIESTQTFIHHSLVFENSNLLEICGADPSAILGISPCPASSATLYASSLLPVIVLEPGIVVGMASATTPTTAHLNVEYGIAMLSSGNWVVDIGDTSATRVNVGRIDATAGIFYVTFLPASLQGQPIVS